MTLTFFVNFADFIRLKTWKTWKINLCNSTYIFNKFSSFRKYLRRIC